MTPLWTASAHVDLLDKVMGLPLPKSSRLVWCHVLGLVRVGRAQQCELAMARELNVSDASVRLAKRLLRVFGVGDWQAPRCPDSQRREVCRYSVHMVRLRELFGLPAEEVRAIWLAFKASCARAVAVARVFSVVKRAARSSVAALWPRPEPTAIFAEDYRKSQERKRDAGSAVQRRPVDEAPAGPAAEQGTAWVARQDESDRFRALLSAIGFDRDAKAVPD